MNYPTGSQISTVEGLLSSFLLMAATSQLIWAEEIRSPFERAKVAPVQETTAATVAPSRLDQMEFTGLMAIGPDVTISLYDSKTKESVWVPLDGLQDGFAVSGWDETDGTISVSLNGITKQIAINENEIITLKQAAPARSVAGNTNAPKKPVRVKDPETIKKEEEARQFVSNILANGMRQREEFRRSREARIAEARNN
ncbi:MAG: hypothetical protein VYC82_10075 [Verrucomicrobiota bacterium]|nr:hypothetical protein [Verrucomicrobiota bacterium]